jgi:hypothetical protein
MKGIYPRGSGFQVKLKLKGIDKRVTGTFPTFEEAATYINSATAASSLSD